MPLSKRNKWGGQNMGNSASVPDPGFYPATRGRNAARQTLKTGCNVLIPKVDIGGRVVDHPVRAHAIDKLPCWSSG